MNGALALLGDVVILLAMGLPWVVGLWWAFAPVKRQATVLERIAAALEKAVLR